MAHEARRIGPGLALGLLLASCSQPVEIPSGRAQAMPLFAHPGGCRQCHRAVGDDMPLLARADQLCSGDGCHAARAADPPRLHGPFAARACTACHLTHSSPQPHLLMRAEPDLCRGCHEELLYCPLGNGSGSAAACTSCHGGHGGEGPYLLRAALVDRERKEALPRVAKGLPRR